jgi:hypothetical protein
VKTPNKKEPIGGSHPHADVVVDTNVLAHSANESSVEHADSIEFLVWLSEEPHRFWALDDNGKSAPMLQTSLLWAEYQGTLSPSSTAMLLFQQVIAAGRLCFAERPRKSQRTTIMELLPRNRKDRVVLGAAVNTGSKWLVSNDYADFTADVRARCLNELGVRISGPQDPAA